MTAVVPATLNLGGMLAFTAKMLGSRASAVPPKAKKFFDFPYTALTLTLEIGP